MNVQADSQQHQPPQQDSQDGGQQRFEQGNGDIATIPGNNKADNDVEQKYEAEGTTSSKHDLLLLSEPQSESRCWLTNWRLGLPANRCQTLHDRHFGVAARIFAGPAPGGGRVTCDAGGVARWR